MAPRRPLGRRSSSRLAASGRRPLAQIARLYDHHRHEKHRELHSTPQAAWELARKEKRSALRLAPKCPWWPYVFSQRSQTRVGPDGRISVGSQRLRIEQPQVLS